MLKKSPKTGLPKRLVLIDAHAVIHRAYHALPKFTSSKGEPTGALYGISTMLMKIITDLKPDYIVAAYDLPGPTYRHEAYEEYKSHRKKSEPDLVLQIERSRDIFTVLNIPIYSSEGFEADDILGTVVRELKDNPGVEIVIASGDKDTLQLVKEKKVQVFTLRKGVSDTIMYDENAVLARYGFSPELIPDFKGLSGDPSDNIPGIKGIGEKTASTLISNFGTIENIYKKLKPAKGKEIFKEKGLSDRIIKLLEEGEEEALFSKTLATIRTDAPVAFNLPLRTWKEGFSVKKAKELFTLLEFRSLVERLKSLNGLQNGEMVEEEEKEVSLSEHVIRKLQVMASLVNPNATDPSLEEIFRLSKTENPIETEGNLKKQIEKMNMDRVWKEIEEPLIPIVLDMEKTGIKIDPSIFKKLSIEGKEILNRLEKDIWKEAGQEFNINSPKQLGEILFNKLNLKAERQKKTSGGALSTKESELKKLKDSHPIIQLILEYRESAKIMGTYLEPLPSLADQNSRLHTRFAQIGAGTGRMASKNPNLQNIPKGGRWGDEIRKGFIAEKGFVLTSFDYSQIELRIAAFMSHDENLINIFKKDGDIHEGVASLVFKVKKEEVTQEMRRHAKAINFGVLYGMGVNALKENMGTDRETASKFYNEYFSRFSVLAKYLEGVKENAYRKGYTETLFGRRRYFEGFKSSLPYVRASAERMAINAPLQGTAADIIKLAMVKINAFLKKESFNKKAMLVLQVHDELVYEMEEKSTKTIVPEIKKIMENVLTLKETLGVPIIANASIGKNWCNMS